MRSCLVEVVDRAGQRERYLTDEATLARLQRVGLLEPELSKHELRVFRTTEKTERLVEQARPRPKKRRPKLA